MNICMKTGGNVKGDLAIHVYIYHVSLTVRSQFPDSKYFLRYILPLKITTIVGHLILKGPLYFVISFIIARTESLIDCPVFGQLVMQYPDRIFLARFLSKGARISQSIMFAFLAMNMMNHLFSGLLFLRGIVRLSLSTRFFTASNNRPSLVWPKPKLCPQYKLFRQTGL